MKTHIRPRLLIPALAAGWGVACGDSTGSKVDGAPGDAESGDGTLADAGLSDGAQPDGQAGELCNGLDDDGDGLVDEGLESFCGGCGRPYDLTARHVYRMAY